MSHSGDEWVGRVDELDRTRRVVCVVNHGGNAGTVI